MTADAAELGAALPDYVIGELLGRGQFGLVWAARHRRLDRAAAVKLLTGGAVADPRNAERFRREARLLAQIDHGHVVRVHDYRETGGRSLLIMERLTGGTLADRLHTGMNAESILVAVVAAASGLHHLHRQGVLHRDVKPANLMFDAAGVLKVTDFGTARGQDLLRGVTDIVGPVAPGTDVHRAVTVNIGDLTGLDCTSPGEFIGPASPPPSRPRSRWAWLRPRSARRPTSTRWGSCCTRRCPGATRTRSTEVSRPSWPDAPANPRGASPTPIPPCRRPSGR